MQRAYKTQKVVERRDDGGIERRPTIHPRRGRFSVARRRVVLQDGCAERIAANDAEDVRSTRRPRAIDQEQKRCDQDQSHGRAHLSRGHLPLKEMHYTHPHIVATAVHLTGVTGATRIRVLESPWSTADPIGEFTNVR